MIIGGKRSHEYQFHVKKEQLFFLWGAVPKEHKVPIDKILADAGIKSASKIKIREYQSFTNSLVSVLSLGLIYPVNYEISGFGISPSASLKRIRTEHIYRDRKSKER